MLYEYVFIYIHIYIHIYIFVLPRFFVIIFISMQCLMGVEGKAVNIYISVGMHAFKCSWNNL